MSTWKAVLAAGGLLTLSNGITQCTIDLSDATGDGTVAVVDGSETPTPGSTPTPTPSPTPNGPQNALAALAMAGSRPVDLVMIGDSTQVFNIYGWDAALAKAYAARFGVWATPLLPQDTGLTVYSNQGYMVGGLSGATGSRTGADPYFDDRRLPDGNYLNVSGDMTSLNGIYVKKGGEIDVSSQLRYAVYYGTYSSAAGSFTPTARNNGNNVLVANGPTVNTGTGTLSEGEAGVTIPASTRNFDLAFRIRAGGSGTTPTGPMMVLAQRVFDLNKNRGISLHSMYALGGQSLYDMAGWATGAFPSTSGQQPTLARFTWYFDKLRSAQIARGFQPIVVIRITSGFNDQTEKGTPSFGPLHYADSSSADGYVDNLEAIVARMKQVWTENKWPINELFFEVVPSYPVSTPDSARLEAYRGALFSRFSGRPGFSVVDPSKFMSVGEYSSYGGLVDSVHFSNGLADELARREVTQIPN